VVAALAAWHEQHAPAAEALEAVEALPAHAVLEAYSVLTRLPGGLAVPPALAASVLRERFPVASLRLSDAEREDVLDRLSGAGVFGGAAHDALVGLEAAAHGEVLLTLDERARTTYQRLGVAYRALPA
jgi:hypothetical protein